MSPTPSLFADPERLAAYRSVLKATTGQPASNRVLSVATRASRDKTSASQLRRWLLTAADTTELRGIAEDPVLFRKLYAMAARRQRSGGTPSSAAAVRARVARLLVGTVLGQQPTVTQSLATYSSTIDVKARCLTAIVAVRILTRTAGWDTVLTSCADLGTDLAMSRGGARSALTAAIDQGYLRRRQQRPGGGQVLAMRNLSTASQREAVERNWQLVLALAGRSFVDPTGAVTRSRDIVLSASHHSWHYGGFGEQLGGSKIWLSALCLHTGTDPATVGLSQRHYRPCVKALTAVGLGSDATSDVIEALDWIGEGAAERSREAKQKRAVEVAARKSALVAHRASAAERRAAVAAVKAEARAFVDSLASPPHRDASQADAGGWIAAVRLRLADVPESHRAAVRTCLAERLRAAGFTADEAKVNAGALMPENGAQAA